MKKLIAILLCIPLALFRPVPAAEYDPVGLQITGVHAPYITGDGLPSGTDFFTDESFHENRITVINFWDSGCMNCRIEMPDFELAYQNYRGMGAGFLGVATRWIGGPYEQCITILNDLGITYPNVFIDEGFTAFTSEYHHCPETMIVDENGFVLSFFDGRIGYAELEAGICRCLASPGDTDCDGELSFSDVSLLCSYIMNDSPLSPLGLAAADMDANGLVDELDIPAICLALMNSAE